MSAGHTWKVNAGQSRGTSHPVEVWQGYVFIYAFLKLCVTSETLVSDRLYSLVFFFISFRLYGIMKICNKPVKIHVRNSDYCITVSARDRLPLPFNKAVIYLGLRWQDVQKWPAAEDVEGGCCDLRGGWQRCSGIKADWDGKTRNYLGKNRL